jgi:hypothetical protein
VRLVHDSGCVASARTHPSSVRIGKTERWYDHSAGTETSDVQSKTFVLKEGFDFKDFTSQIKKENRTPYLERPLLTFADMCHNDASNGRCCRSTDLHIVLMDRANEVFGQSVFVAFTEQGGGSHEILDHPAVDDKISAQVLHIWVRTAASGSSKLT